MGSWARLALTTAWFGFSLLAVVRIAHGVLWKPAVAATEWGHYLALIGLVGLLGSWSTPHGRMAVALSIAATTLFATPSLRAMWVSRDLPARFTAAFGPIRATPDARPAPFVITDLVRPLTAGPAPVTHTFPAADGALLPLDLTVPDGVARAPLLITIHGGSWNSGDRTVLPELARYLAARGVAVAAIQYRLAPAHHFPAQRDDVLAALAWLKAHADELGLDPDRVVLHGRSAGGHLALSAAHHVDDPAIRGVIAMYPPTDLVWSWDHPTKPWIIDTPGTLTGLMGGPPRGPADPAWVDASPMSNVRRLPTLLVHGGRDELVYAEQSHRMGAALAAAGAPHLVVELPWGTHGCDANPSGPGGQISEWLVERFLASVW